MAEEKNLNVDVLKGLDLTAVMSDIGGTGRSSIPNLDGKESLNADNRAGVKGIPIDKRIFKHKLDSNDLYIVIKSQDNEKYVEDPSNNQNEKKTTLRIMAIDDVLQLQKTGEKIDTQALIQLELYGVYQTGFNLQDVIQLPYDSDDWFVTFKQAKMFDSYVPSGFKIVTENPDIVVKSAVVNE